MAEGTTSVLMEFTFSGIPPEVTLDSLTNFLQTAIFKKTTAMKSVQFGNIEDDVATVILENPTDLMAVQDACNENPLGGTVLRVEPIVKGEATATESSVEESPGMPATEVLLSELSPSVTDDYLTSFLECSLDCDVEAIRRGSRPGTAVVVFPTAAVDLMEIQKVCSENPLEGCVLKVEAVKKGDATSAEPPALALQRTIVTEVLLLGLPPSVSDDYLINFLECSMDCDIDTIRRGSRVGAAVVVFQTALCLEEVKKFSRDNPVEGHYLKVEEVDPGGTVLIQNPKPATTTKSFRFYFMNTKRSGGVGLVNIYRDVDDKFIILCFKSKEVAETVAGRSHVLEGGTLDCKMLDPNLDVFPVSGADCMQAGSDKQDDAYGADYIQAGSDKQEDVHVANYLQTGSDKQNDAYLANYLQAGLDKQNDVCGSPLYHSDVHSGAEAEAPTTQAADYQHGQDLLITPFAAVVEGVHHVYCSLLETFSDIIAQMYFGIQVSAQNCCVKIEGKEADVRRFQKLVENLCDMQKSSGYIVKVAKIFKGWEDVFDDIEKDVVQNMYYLLTNENQDKSHLCIGQSDLDNSCPLSFDRFLLKYVSRRDVLVESSGNVSIDDWNWFLEHEIEQRFSTKMTVLQKNSENMVVVVGSVSLIQEVADMVQDFFRNARIECAIPLSQKQAQFLNVLCGDFLEELESVSGSDKLRIHITEQFCQIEGFRAGVSQAEDKVKRILARFKSKRAIFDHPDLQSLRTDSRHQWERMIAAVSAQHCCIIDELPDCRVTDANDDCLEFGHWNAVVVHSFKMVASQQLNCHVVEGVVEDLKVDAVVMFEANLNSVEARPSPPPLPTPVSNGGARPKQISRSSSTDSDDTVRGKDLMVTQSGGLPCKAIIHINAGYFLPPAGFFSKDTAVTTVTGLLVDILETCNRYQFRSLALPLDGILGRASAIDVVCGAVVQSLKDLMGSGLPSIQQWEQRGTSLTDVCLCSARAALLQGLTYFLENDHQGFTPTQSHEGFKFLTSEPFGGVSVNPNAIKFSKGDISKYSADVFIVPLDIESGLDLGKSKVTSSLAKAGGFVVQNSVLFGNSNWHSVPVEERYEELAEEHVIAGSPGFLSVREVFYVYLPPWGPGVKKMLKERILKCLSKAVSNGHKSVAMTTLGVGPLGYPPEFAAKTSLTAVADFMEHERLGTKLKSVTFVIFPTDQSSLQAYSLVHGEWQKCCLATGIGGDKHTTGLSRQASTTPAARKGKGQKAKAKLQAVASMENQVGINVKLGNITSEKCDVAVNCTNQSFDLKKGAVSNAFRNQCSELSSICCTKGNLKKMKNKGRVLTPVPKSPLYKHILHLDLERFIQKPEETLGACINHVLDAVPACHSIAFPALGTGASHKMSPEELLGHMWKALHVNVKKAKDLEEVRIVVSDKNTYSRLSSQLSKICPSPDPPGAANARCAAPLAQGSSLYVAGDRPRPSPRHSVSLFVFSDSEERRQAAVNDLNMQIMGLLGPRPSRQTGQEAGRGSHRDSLRTNYSEEDPAIGCFDFFIV